MIRIWLPSAMRERNAPSAMREIAKLEEFLMQHAPADVLMPAVGKAPKMRHSGGAWSWALWRSHLDQLTSNRGDKSVCVLLQSLCVIDVDSEEQALELESRFGDVLDGVPTERTARGRHYWFRRSELCDSEEYFDIRSPRQKGIDFKTRCQNGTSGVIIVAPSPEKSWTRAPWDIGVKLRPIPDDLLHHVSRPKRTKITVPMTFSDGRSVSIQMHRETMEIMTFFEPFMEGGGESDGSGGIANLAGPIPVPCRVEEFCSAVRLLSEDRVHSHNLRGMRQAIRTADMLGVSREFFFQDQFLEKVIAFSQMYAVPWSAICASSNIVDMTTIHTLAYAPPGPAASRCMYQMWRGNHACSLAPGEVILRGDEVQRSCLKRIPKVVMSLMHTFPLALAGGGALAATSTRKKFETSDWDLFVYGLESSDLADAMLRRVCRMLKAYGSDTEVVMPRVSRNAVTFVVQESLEQPHVVIQIVLQLYEHPTDVIRSFDLAPSQIVLWKDKDASKLSVRATRGCIESLRRMSIIMHDNSEFVWNTMTAFRVLKYATKGFAIFVPGIVENAIDSPPEDSSPPPSADREGYSSARLLLQMQAATMNIDPGTSSTACELANKFLKSASRSSYAYDSQLKNGDNPLAYVYSLLSFLVKTAFSTLRRRKPDARVSVHSQVMWKRTGQRLATRMPAGIADAHDDRRRFRKAGENIMGLGDVL